jgi:hypothetical protein
MTTAHLVRDEARRRIAELHGGTAGSDVTIKVLNTVVRMLAPQNATLAAHVALLACSNELEANPSADVTADRHWTAHAVSVEPIKRNTIDFGGVRFGLPDQGKLALAIGCANAAIAAGVRAGDLRWHHGKTDFAWTALDGSGVTMDAPTLLAFGAAALNAS